MNAAEKATAQLFRQLMNHDKDHLRVGGGRADGTEVTLIGNVWEMHGPDGVCTCCHGRTGDGAA